MTVAFHTWLTRLAGGGTPFAAHCPPVSPVPSSREALFDRFHAHTSKCTICMAALANLKTARVAAYVAAGAALAWGERVIRYEIMQGPGVIHCLWVMDGP
jgi:hypothetical protein